MEDIKKLGIWMCHSNFRLVEFTNEPPAELPNKENELTHDIATHDATMQNESFHLQTESFKKLGIAVEKYNEVVLFGPVDAKAEFMKFLNADKRFGNIKIDIKQTNEMTEDQQVAFVGKYFAG